MKPSEYIYPVIKHFEGLKLKAYQDAGGVWTIGHGATSYEDGTPVKQGDTVTPYTAGILLVWHVSQAANDVRRLVTSDLTQCQFDALVSFVYNIGSGKFKNYTLRRIVNQNPNDLDGVAEWFPRYVFAGKKKLPGLVKRRAVELRIYLYGNYETE